MLKGTFFLFWHRFIFQLPHGQSKTTLMATTFCYSFAHAVNITSSVASGCLLSHHNIWHDAQVAGKAYRYYDPKTKGLDFAGLLEDLEVCPPSAVLGCYPVTDASPCSCRLPPVVRLFFCMPAHTTPRELTPVLNSGRRFLR